jgi:hypothetical protein
MVDGSMSAREERGVYLATIICDVGRLGASSELRKGVTPINKIKN